MVLWGIPIAVLIPLAIVAIQSISFIINGIVQFESGTPLTKEDVMAQIQTDWNTALGANLVPELASMTWPMVEPLFSSLYDIILPMMSLFRVVKINADGTFVPVKGAVITPEMVTKFGTHITAKLKWFGFFKIPQEGINEIKAYLATVKR